MDRNLRRIVTSSRELEVLPWYRFWKINTLEYPDLPLDVASARLKALLDSGNCPDFDCRFREENGFPTIHVITLNGFVPKFDIIWNMSIPRPFCCMVFSVCSCLFGSMPSIS